VSDAAALHLPSFAHTAWVTTPPSDARAKPRVVDADDEPLLTARERDAVQQNPWFAALPLLLRHDLLRRCTVRRYRSGETVRVDASNRVQIDAVACGAVAVSMAAGHAAAFDYLPQGTWLVDPGLLARGERAHRVVAHGRSTTILSVDADELAAAMSSHGGLALALLRLAHERTLEQAVLLDELSSSGLAARLARCLLRLCERFGEPEAGGIRIALDLKQDALAALVRASRARVNLQLKELERSGIVEVERRMLVLDAKALAACARA
jgi:CRP-like cAMP-binding protein